MNSATALVTAEVFGAAALAIAFAGVADKRRAIRSTRALMAALIVHLVWLLGDAAAYTTDGRGWPDFLLYAINYISYIGGQVSFIFFARYCQVFMSERTSVSKWAFRIPYGIMAAEIVYVTVLACMGRLFTFSGGECTMLSSIPVWLSPINIAVVLSLPAVSLSKVKDLGVRAALFLGLYGIIPVIGLLLVLAGMQYNYTAALGTLAFLILCIMLQGDLTYEKEQSYRKALSEKNEELAAMNEEQAAQMEEISALNAQLQENQAHLEESSAEQEAHLEDLQVLNASLADYNSIIANAGYGVWHIYLKDGAAPRMHANAKMAQLLGIDAAGMTEEAVYSAWYDRIEPDAIPSVQASVGEMLSGQFSENTYLWNHPSKGPIYVRCGGTARKAEDGTDILSGYHADVTAIVQAEQRQKEALEEARRQAEAASAAKSAFLFNMSHDIRTPMNAILGYTDLAVKHYAEREKCLDYLHKTQDANKFLLSLVNDVLEVARIESGRVELDETIVRPGEITGEMHAMFETQMKQKGITLTSEKDIHTEYIYCDGPKVRQIYLNILSNAYKYTPAGGTVTTRLLELPCEKPGYTRLRIVVADTGIGMAKEYLPHIFEEFSRARTSTESRMEGTGLGMPIVKKLVDLMGGTIGVESEPGKGSTFTVDIDFRIAAGTQPQPAETDAATTADFTGKHILLAEDNDLNAEIAQEILQEAGFTIDRAEDGVVCVDMLTKAPAGTYDLILMDIQMPNLNGYEAAGRIRSLADPEKAGIPILAMTANAFDEDRRNALNAGMNGHLAKPIDTAVLMKTLSETLG